VALIVEDEPDIAADLGDLVASLGHDHLHAATQEEARSIVERGGFCYVLLDLQIKLNAGSIKARIEAGTGVLELVRHLYPGRVDDHWHELPVIVVSGHTAIDTVAETFKRGIDDFIPKPVDERSPIAQKIRECLRRSGRADHACCEKLRSPKGATSPEATRDARATHGNKSSGIFQFQALSGGEAVRILGKTTRGEPFDVVLGHHERARARRHARAANWVLAAFRNPPSRRDWRYLLPEQGIAFNANHADSARRCVQLALQDYPELTGLILASKKGGLTVVGEPKDLDTSLNDALTRGM
jgi:DNA-binding response OmpR family regulator